MFRIFLINRVQPVVFLVALLVMLLGCWQANAQPIWEKVDPFYDSTFYTIKTDEQGTMYAHTRFNWIFVSTDDGDTWNRAPEYKQNLKASDLFVRSSASIFVATNLGVLRSTDGAQTWINFDSALTTATRERWHVWENSIGHIYTMIRADSLMRTTDNGHNWTYIGTRYPSPVFLLKNDDMYAHFTQSFDGPFRRSFDYGTTWEIYPAFQYDSLFTDMQINDAGVMVLTSNHEMYISTDSGNHWVTVQTNPFSAGFDNIYFIDDASFIVSTTLGNYNNIALFHVDGRRIMDLTGNLPRNPSGQNMEVDDLTIDRYGRLYITARHYHLGRFEQGLYRTTTPIVTSAPWVSAPSALSLAPAYPNPVTSGSPATVEFALPTSGQVTLTLCNTLGQELHRIEKRLQPGTHTERISTTGLNPGVYYYTLTAAGKRNTEMLVVR